MHMANPDQRDYQSDYRNLLQAVNAAQQAYAMRVEEEQRSAEAAMTRAADCEATRTASRQWAETLVATVAAMHNEAAGLVARYRIIVADTAIPSAADARAGIEAAHQTATQAIEQLRLEVAALNSRERADHLGAYGLVGGYAAALTGLIVPGILIFSYSFTAEEPIDMVGRILLYFLLGAVFWVPLSVLLATILGIFGMLPGLAVGVVAVILFHLTDRMPAANRVSRAGVFALSGLVFGYLTGRLYHASFFFPLLSPLTSISTIVFLVGAFAGLAAAIAGPRKPPQNRLVADTWIEKAKGFLAMPFQLSYAIAGRADPFLAQALDVVETRAYPYVESRRQKVLVARNDGIGSEDLTAEREEMDLPNDS